jgi:transglutaminase-like putative cysteine protease
MSQGASINPGGALGLEPGEGAAGSAAGGGAGSGWGFRLMTLGSALLAVLAYCAAEGRPLLAAISLGVGVASAWMARQEPGLKLPRLSINLLVLAATLNAAVGVLTGRGVMPGADSQPLVSTLTDFLAVVLLIKMLDRGRARDEAQLLGLSVFVVIGAVLTSNSLLLGAALIVYTPLTIAASVLLQVYAGVQTQTERARLLGAGAEGLGRTARAGRGELARWAGLAVLASLLLGVAAFIATPRTLTQQALGAWGSVSLGARADFSDQITLGQAGMLSASEEPVMDVLVRDREGRVVTPEGEVLYLRGAVLDEYVSETGQWRSKAPDERYRPGGAWPASAGLLRADSIGPGRTLALTDNAGAAARGVVVQQITIRAAAAGRSPLFALWRPISLNLEAGGQVNRLEHDGTLLREGGPGRVAYSVESAPDDGPPPRGEARRDRRSRERIAGVFAEGAVREIASGVLRERGLPTDARGVEAAEIRRMIVTLRDHLRSNFRYSTEMVAPRNGEDPIEMFLLRTKQGHCEYFASALTAMLRSAGIDARVVTGYAAGELNPISGQYVVRRSDAHAWVEARVREASESGGERWETFDATPPANLPHTLRAGHSGGLWSRLRQVYEALEFTWIESVVSFDQSGGPRVDLVAQAAAARERARAVAASVRSVIERVQQWLPGLGRGPSAAAALLAAAGAGYGAWIVGRRTWAWLIGWRRRHGRYAAQARGADGRPVAFYAELLETLDRAGLAKPEHRPPLAHAEALRVRGVGEAGSDIARRLGERFYRVRFGGTALAPEEEAQAAEDLRALRAALESAPSQGR